MSLNNTSPAYPIGLPISTNKADCHELLIHCEIFISLYVIFGPHLLLSFRLKGHTPYQCADNLLFDDKYPEGGKIFFSIWFHMH